MTILFDEFLDFLCGEINEIFGAKAEIIFKDNLCIYHVHKGPIYIDFYIEEIVNAYCAFVSDNNSEDGFYSILESIAYAFHKIYMGAPF